MSSLVLNIAEDRRTKICHLEGSILFINCCIDASLGRAVFVLVQSLKLSNPFAGEWATILFFLKMDFSEVLATNTRSQPF